MAGDLIAIVLGSAGAMIWLLLLLSKLSAREFRQRGFVAKD
ncbi:hypothetical protein [Sinorhizobium alkalisoli]|nr:hypothetical protein [Sinorhizobium alkalisoli]QFI65762.1 hypothetical protein EKH55_0888 [Sinorhizobium alkalisoli]